MNKADKEKEVAFLFEKLHGLSSIKEPFMQLQRYFYEIGEFVERIHDKGYAEGHAKGFSEAERSWTKRSAN